MTERPPSTDAADRAFARFEAHGEPQDLARVFDQLAPLLLLANHLVGDRAAAEDLVQLTFVEVIADADRFESGRPVAPWLTTIPTWRAACSLRTDGEAELDEERARVVSRHPGERRPLTSATVADDGTFALPCVPADDFELALDLQDGGEAVMAVPGLGLGETRRVDFDVRGREPAHFTGIATVDGRPIEGLGVDLVGACSTTTDARGRFAVPRMRPGRFVAIAQLGPSRTRWIAPDRVRVEPGTVTDLRLAFVTRRLEVRVLDGNGLPAVGRSVCAAATEPAEFADRVIVEPVVTDTTGLAVLERVTRGPVTIAVFEPGAWVPRVLEHPDAEPPVARTGPVSAGQLEVTVRLR